MTYTRKQIADALDLAVLKPTASPRDVVRAARKVKTETIRSICVAPVNVGIARLYADDVAAVVGFPHGNSSPAVKLLEASLAVGHGATELDVVVNYGHFLAGKRQTVREELTLLVNLLRPMPILVKAILETCYYTQDQIRDACKLCVDCGVDFVKTSTGFASGGATPEAVQIMVDALRGSEVEVKASGGIKTYKDAARYLDLGCTRLGASVFEELLP
jgi:deoxyribose-phosphate aldolase